MSTVITEPLVAAGPPSTALVWPIRCPVTMIPIRWPALNVCSVGIVGIENSSFAPIVTGVASWYHSESRLEESRPPRVTRHCVTFCVGLETSR